MKVSALLLCATQQASGLEGFSKELKKSALGFVGNPCEKFGVSVKKGALKKNKVLQAKCRDTVNPGAPTARGCCVLGHHCVLEAGKYAKFQGRRIQKEGATKRVETNCFTAEMAKTWNKPGDAPAGADPEVQAGEAAAA